MKLEGKDEPVTLEITAGQTMIQFVALVFPLLQVLLVIGMLAAPASAATRTLAIMLGAGILFIIVWQRVRKWRAER